ncbi:MAG: dockerin type I domain-containing protein [bacterium]|nr:dockerin type I domain-containing protein [bacterium]
MVKLKAFSYNLIVRKGFLYTILFFGLTAFFLLPQSASAEVATGSSLSSDNFKILDAQHSLFGGTASISSSLFSLISVVGDVAIGSASSQTFGLRSGFLYYPKVTAATLNTAIAGDAQVALSWTAATAYQGWSIGGYNVCHKSTGSYTCVDVGNVVSSTKTGLTNGTTYTFKIEAYDGLAAKNVIAESNEKTAAPASAATPTPTPASSGGGGGGGYVAPAPTSGKGTIILKGTAYPDSTVSIYIDGVLASSIKAGSTAKFDVKMENINAGDRTIAISSIDLNGRKSITAIFSVTLGDKAIVTLTDILLAPTIDLNSFRLAKGEKLRIFGQSAPVSEVNIHVASEETVTKTIADSNGAYAIIFDTKPLAEEDHTTKSRAVLEKIVSPFSHVLQFSVGKGGIAKSADLNKDGRVNIIDFSILLFWWNTTQQKGLDVADINGDRKINIIDFSIMLFQWTG